MQMREAIDAVMRGQSLSYEQTHSVMRAIMTGEATDAQIGGFLVGLSVKGETVEEISAAAQVMRELMIPVTVHGDNIVDIVGTGGDGPLCPFLKREPHLRHSVLGPPGPLQ